MEFNNSCKPTDHIFFSTKILPLHSDVVKDSYQLLYGDCLERMFEMKNGSVDLTVTSPPYDNIRNYEDTLEWNEKIWKELILHLYRVTKDGGVVVWIVGDSAVNGTESGTSFKQALWAKRCGFKLHDTMIYSRYAMPNNSKRYAQDFEYMFVLVKGDLKTFNPIMKPCTYAGSGTSPTMRDKSGTLKGKGRRIIKEKKKRSNIWHYTAGASKSTKDKYAHEHPAICPELLAQDHILSWSNVGDVVFDPMSGSGTSGKMAILNKRKFIGIEKVSKYFKISRKRLKNACKSLASYLW